MHLKACEMYQRAQNKTAEIMNRASTCNHQCPSCQRARATPAITVKTTKSLQNSGFLPFKIFVKCAQLPCASLQKEGDESFCSTAFLSQELHRDGVTEKGEEGTNVRRPTGKKK